MLNQSNLLDDVNRVKHGIRRLASPACWVLFVAAGLLSTLSARAATTYIIASTSMASTNGDGICTLTEAIESARTNATVNECVSAGGPYTINLQSNATYTATTVGFTNGTLGNSAILFDGSQPLTINGNGATLSQSGQQQRIFVVSGGSLTLRNLTITGGAATGSGASFSGWGGAILATFPGTVLSLEDVTITGNVASVEASAIYTNNSPVINIHRSTVSGNTFTGANASQIRIDFSAQLNVANSTLAGNFRPLVVVNSGSARLSSITLSSSAASGLFADNGTSISVQNSILNGSCSFAAGTATLINNASGSSSCSPAIAAPVLETLAANGGPTQTSAPRLPSATKDAAPGCTYLSSGTNPLFANGAAITTDQRGFARDANCDLGSVEAMTISPASLPGGTFGTPYSATVSQTGGAAPVTFSVAGGALPAGLSLNPTTGDITGTPSAAGTSPQIITVTDAGGFKSEIRYTITVARADQTITFNAQTTASRPFVASGTFAINPLATASSGLTPTYVTLTAGVCGVSGTTVTMFTAGTCTIRAQQTGNTNYNAAPTVTQSVTITPGVQTLTFNAQSTASQTFVAGGTFAINPVATTNAGAPSVEHSSLTPAVCTVAGTTVTMVSAGTCTLRASHVGNSNYQAAVSGTQNVIINPGVQLITFAALPDRALGSANFTVTATGGASGNAVTFTSLTPTICSATGVNGSLITLLLSGTCTLRANQAAGGNYAAATPVDQGFRIGTSATFISISAAASTTPYGAPAMFTAIVNGINVTGSVTFYDGVATICSQVPVVNGSAQCAVSNLAEGGHSISASFAGDANNTPAQSEVIVHVVPKIGIHQGVWWGGPLQNGWGMSIIEHGDIMAAAWYHFDASGKPVWLLMPGCAWNAAKTVCSGSLQRSRASWFGNFRTSTFTGTTVGSMTLTFTDASRGRMEFVVDGVSGSKDIERMNIGGNPRAPFDYTDIWWGGQTENGWGVSVHQADNALVGVWYTYDAAGEPTWMLFNSGAWVNASMFRAVLFRPTGSPMIGATYDVTRLQTPVVGEFYLQFRDNNHAEMSYFVDNILQARNITKMRF